MAKNTNDILLPGISLSKKRGEILIYRSTIQCLHEPCFIQFLMDSNQGRLAVQSCDSQTLDSFLVPEYDPKDWVFRLYSDPLLKIIWRNTGWKKNLTYRCTGSYHEKYELVEFDLNKAEIVSENTDGNANS